MYMKSLVRYTDNNCFLEDIFAIPYLPGLFMFSSGRHKEMSSLLADPDEGGGLRVSANECSCAKGAQINFGDLTP
jgi:hypothetical protein